MGISHLPLPAALILPMWLRLSETRREGGGRTRKSETTSADSSFTARLSSALSLRGPGPWEQGSWGASSQRTMTQRRHQGDTRPCHSEWPWGPPQLARTKNEWANPASQQRSDGSGRPEAENELPTLQFPPSASVWPGQPSGLGAAGLDGLAGQAGEGKEAGS